MIDERAELAHLRSDLLARAATFLEDSLLKTQGLLSKIDERSYEYSSLADRARRQTLIERKRLVDRWLSEHRDLTTRELVVSANATSRRSESVQGSAKT